MATIDVVYRVRPAIALRALTLTEVQQVREWRNDPAVLPMLRTGYKTEDEQADFYRDVVQNPASAHRYYALVSSGQFVGMGGLTYLSHVPGHAEISLILGPQYRGQGLGTAAVDALRSEGFGPMGLIAIIGECYDVGNLDFWTRQIVRHPARLSWTWSRPT